MAVSFLTTFPARRLEFRADAPAMAAPWYTVVGLLLGVVLAIAYWAAAAWLPAAVAAVLVVALWAGLTGGLHLDGLADCGDGLLSTAIPERRLEIMRDPRVGSFGAVALVLLLLLKAVTLGNAHAPMLALLLAPTWARWLLLFAARQPAARPGGMGEALTRALTPTMVMRSAILPVAALLAVGWWEWRAFAGALLAALAAFAVVLLARQRIGGVTGDVFGAVVEVSEVAMLLAFCLA